MAIDPLITSTIRVGQLPPEIWSMSDLLPHEVADLLTKGTVQGLADLIKDYIGTVSSLAFNPTTVLDGETLPFTETNEWILVGKGTFTNVGGGSDITTTEELNALVSNGTTWSIGVEIPINVELAGIVQTIRSGFTTTTPSENAVFDALALKANTTDIPDFSLKEDKSNKQNDLTVDGTGGKYPTVDAINTANFLQNLQRVLEIGNVAQDVGMQFISASETAQVSIDNESVIVQNGTSNISILAHALSAENVTEIMEYLSNSIVYTDKASGNQSKLWITRVASGFAEFFVNPNKPSGSYTLATTDEVDLKLNIADYNDRFKGVFLTEAALNIAFPTASAGDYAQVNETGSQVVINYNWDAEDNIWVEGGSGGSGATNTDTLPEGSSNLYFTTARVLATALSGISFATGGPIVSTDSILVMAGKLQKQITDLSTIYQAILTDVNFGSFINGLTAKTTPIDADSISIVDSADSNKQKKVSLTNFKAYLKTYFDTLYQAVLVSGTNIKTYAGVSILGSGDIPVQATITTATSITTATTTTGSYTQHGKNIIIDNGANAINYTINAAITASFVKHGTGAITFVQGSGRTLVQVDGTAILNGALGSTATISSVGTTDYLRISNA